MKRVFLIFTTLLLVFALAPLAAAEYGQWEKLYSLSGQPGLSNAAFMSLGVGDLDNLYTAGMQQVGALSIASGWRSGTGGESWDIVMQGEAGGGDECDIMNLFTFMLANAAYDADHAAWAGIHVNPECIEENTFPACLFKCMIQIEPVIYVTDDGGQTLTMAELNGTTLINMLMAMQFVDDQLGYAVGMPQLMVRTQDGGFTWNKIPSPGNLVTFYNDLDFINPMTGVVVSGYPEDDMKLTTSGSDPFAQWERLEHIARSVKDPVYRMERTTGGKGTQGKAWRTDDGGATWELVLDTPTDNLLKIDMIDEQRGWIIGEPHNQSIPTSVFVTIDGYNWEDVTDQLPSDLGELTKWTGASIAFQPEHGNIGFIGGAGQKGLFGFTPLIFYTLDGGQTWEFDEEVLDFGNPILDLDWGNAGIAFTAGMDLSTFRYTHGNVPPTAIAGDDQAATTGAEVTLDGSESFDDDGDPITFTWTLVDGPDATIGNADAAAATFTPDEVGDYTFALSVSDGEFVDQDEVMVSVTAGPADDDDDTAADDDDDDDDDAADDDDDDDDDDSGGCGC
jgi:K319L-like, PKD domain